MVIPTEFGWDDVKAERNLAKHSVSFEVAVAVFLDTDLIVVDASRVVEGEVREKAIGSIQGRLFNVVFTMWGTLCRVISARRSNAKEGKRYGFPSPVGSV